MDNCFSIALREVLGPAKRVRKILRSPVATFAYSCGISVTMVKPRTAHRPSRSSTMFLPLPASQRAAGATVISFGLDRQGSNLCSGCGPKWELPAVTFGDCRIVNCHPGQPLSGLPTLARLMGPDHCHSQDAARVARSTREDGAQSLRRSTVGQLAVQSPGRF